MKTDNIASLQALRVAAAFAVIGFHASGPLLAVVPELESWRWWAGVAVNAATRWCVPVFVMITGALLLNRPVEAPSVFYRKRWGALLTPLLFWSAAYLAWRAWLQGRAHLPDLLHALLIGKPHFHLWYLYMLMGLYLAIPWLHRLLHGAGRGRLLVMLALAFTYVAIDPMGMAGHESTTAFHLIPDFVFYLLLGCCLARHPPHWPLRLTVGLMLLSLALILLTIGWGYPRYGMQAGYFALSFFNPWVMLMSVGVFVAFQNHADAWGRHPTVVMLSGLTLGIYLLHPLFLAALPAPTPATAPVWAVVAFVLSALAVWLLRRVPLLRATV